MSSAECNYTMRGHSWGIWNQKGFNSSQEPFFNPWPGQSEVGFSFKSNLCFSHLNWSFNSTCFSSKTILFQWCKIIFPKWNLSNLKIYVLYFKILQFKSTLSPLPISAHMHIHIYIQFVSILSLQTYLHEIQLNGKCCVYIAQKKLQLSLLSHQSCQSYLAIIFFPKILCISRVINVAQTWTIKKIWKTFIEQISTGLSNSEFLSARTLFYGSTVTKLTYLEQLTIIYLHIIAFRGMKLFAADIQYFPLYNNLVHFPWHDTVRRPDNMNTYNWLHFLMNTESIQLQNAKKLYPCPKINYLRHLSIFWQKVNTLNKTYLTQYSVVWD